MNNYMTLIIQFLFLLLLITSIFMIINSTKRIKKLKEEKHTKYKIIRITSILLLIFSLFMYINAGIYQVMNTIPKERDLYKIVEHTSNIYMEYYPYEINENNICYDREIGHFTVEEEKVLKDILKGIKLSFYSWNEIKLPETPNLVNEYRYYGLDYCELPYIDVETKAYIEVGIFRDNTFVGTIIFLNEQEAYFKTLDDKYAKLKGDNLTSAYQYLMQHKNEDDIYG